MIKSAVAGKSPSRRTVVHKKVLSVAMNLLESPQHGAPGVYITKIAEYFGESPSQRRVVSV
jgi:hypothetical protein